MKKIDMWEVMKQRSQEYIDSFEKHNVMQKAFSGDKYIAICFIGDQHLGHLGVDYELAEKHARLIGKTPNAYAIFGGDGIDNFILTKILGAMINQVTTPKEQIYLFEQYVKFFNGHILAMISGNHDRWTKMVSGIDIISWLAREQKILYSPDEFRIELYINDIRYRIYLRHKYRYNSSLNLTHTVKRLLKEGDYDFDIGAIFHHHKYAMESFVWHTKERLAIRTGSYKVADPFARQIGFSRSLSIMPIVILSPTEKKMIAIKDLEEGLKFLKYLNRKTKK